MNYRSVHQEIGYRGRYGFKAAHNPNDPEVWRPFTQGGTEMVQFQMEKVTSTNAIRVFLPPGLCSISVTFFCVMGSQHVGCARVGEEPKIWTKPYDEAPFVQEDDLHLDEMRQTTVYTKDWFSTVLTMINEHQVENGSYTPTDWDAWFFVFAKPYAGSVHSVRVVMRVDTELYPAWYKVNYGEVPAPPPPEPQPPEPEPPEPPPSPGPVTVKIKPENPTLDPSSTIPLYCMVNGRNERAEWAAECGTIDKYNGIYTSPSEGPALCKIQARVTVNGQDYRAYTHVTVREENTSPAPSPTPKEGVTFENGYRVIPMFGTELVSGALWPSGQEHVDQLVSGPANPEHCIIVRQPNGTFAILHVNGKAEKTAAMILLAVEDQGLLRLKERIELPSKNRVPCGGTFDRQKQAWTYNYENKPQPTEGGLTIAQIENGVAEWSELWTNGQTWLALCAMRKPDRHAHEPGQLIALLWNSHTRYTMRAFGLWFPSGTCSLERLYGIDEFPLMFGEWPRRGRQRRQFDRNTGLYWSIWPKSDQPSGKLTNYIANSVVELKRFELKDCSDPEGLYWCGEIE